MKILIIGGDVRMEHLACSLEKRGEDVSTYAVGGAPSCRDLDERLPSFDIIILPLPLSRDGIFINTPQSDEKIEINRILSKCGEGKFILAGKVDKAVKANALARGHRLFDYYAEECFTDENAYITAEGAISIAMDGLEKTLRDSHHLIIGSGRIAKHLLLLLKGMGAHVTVACRNYRDILWARALCADVADLAGDSEIFEGAMSECDAVYNTVPERVIPDECSKKIKSGALYVELVGDESLIPKEMKARAKCVCAKALPARYAPESASALLCRSVEKIIRERVKK